MNKSSELIMILVMTNIVLYIGLFLAYRKIKSLCIESFNILKELLQLKVDSDTTDYTKYDVYKNIDGLYTNKKGGGGKIGANERK